MKRMLFINKISDVCIEYGFSFSGIFQSSFIEKEKLFIMVILYYNVRSTDHA